VGDDLRGEIRREVVEQGGELLHLARRGRALEDEVDGLPDVRMRAASSSLIFTP
jgi:hypothetical protein